MVISVGDILLFQSEVAGKAKFHFCFCYDLDTDRYSFIFLNSDNVFRDHFVIDCSRLPGMKPSRTGTTIFSCPTVIRKTPEQLARLSPKSICTLPSDVALEFLDFAKKVTSMTSTDKARLISALETIGS